MATIGGGRRSDVRLTSQRSPAAIAILVIAALACGCTTTSFVAHIPTLVQTVYLSGAGALSMPAPISDYALMHPTAECQDATFSYSAHRPGTCSHHGGVARDLRSIVN